MSTRSYIIQKLGDGYAGVYCHWDGYPEHTGKLLHDNYTTGSAVSDLIGLGDLSILAATIDGCKAYRDRGDAWEFCKPRKAGELSELVAVADESGCEHVYYFDGRLWQHAVLGSELFRLSDGSEFSEFRALSRALAGDE